MQMCSERLHLEFLAFYRAWMQVQADFNNTKKRADCRDALVAYQIALRVFKDQMAQLWFKSSWQSELQFHSQIIEEAVSCGYLNASAPPDGTPLPSAQR